MIYLCKPHIIKFIISITSLIQLLVYYLLEISLIAFISTSFESFFLSKICYNFSSFQKKKKYKIKGIDFCYKKNCDLNTN